MLIGLSPERSLVFDAAFKGGSCDQPCFLGGYYRADLKDLYGVVELGLENIDMDYRELDYAAVSALRRWRDGGGRRRLKRLRRWEVDEGREADPRGRWRVARVVGVRRPEHRRGRQLEVQVEWAGVDTRSGVGWSVEWVPIRWCTGDVREEARRLEATVYAVPRAAAAPRGSRKSPRLVEGVGGAGDGNGGVDDDDDRGGDSNGGGGDGGGAGSGGDSESEPDWDGGAAGGGAGGHGAAARKVARTTANPLGAARASAGAVARLDPTRVTRRSGQAAEAEAEGAARSAGAGASGGASSSDAVVDDLEVMLQQNSGRKRKEAEMRVRVDGEVDAKMDNGVRINPYFRGRARQEIAEEAEAETGDGGLRCHAGHGMLRRDAGASGLTCDGGCGRALKRGAGW